MNSPWIKPLEVFNEPYLCIPLQNLFLYFPGCISVDQSGDHIYISDSNHHRIIVFDAHGGIQDFIGSSPGFEDGDFENAKFMRPTLWTQSLWTLWVMDLASGTLKEIVRGVEATDSVLRSL
ncbi:unnamed protein product [Cuscuta europaea]|uniref:Uncharacterized protein n=1 Tax=Cuscuta europaea TaxID=41803 RepID=A0A9P0YMV5_CUSEU|nr:unnamed protein product [Cuscuta europaea]